MIPILRREISQNRREISQNRREISQNRREISQNRREISQNRSKEIQINKNYRIRRKIRRNRFNCNFNLNILPYWKNQRRKITRNSSKMTAY